MEGQARLGTTIQTHSALLPGACLFLSLVCWAFISAGLLWVLVLVAASPSPLVLRKVVYSFAGLCCRITRWLGWRGGSVRSRESFSLILDSLTVACPPRMLGVSSKRLCHLGVGMGRGEEREGRYVPKHMKRKPKARLSIAAARTLPRNDSPSACVSSDGKIYLRLTALRHLSLAVEIFDLVLAHSSTSAHIFHFPLVLIVDHGKTKLP